MDAIKESVLHSLYTRLKYETDAQAALAWVAAIERLEASIKKHSSPIEELQKREPQKGDKVTILKNVSPGKYKHSPGWANDMIECLGKPGTIIEIQESYLKGSPMIYRVQVPTGESFFWFVEDLHFQMEDEE